MVTAQWPRLQGWPNKEAYFRELIENYSTTALFHMDHLDLPASYALQFPSGENFGFTMETYRGKGMTRGIFLKQYAKLIIDGYSPRTEESSVDSGDLTPLHDHSLKSGFNVKDLILKQIVSKL